MRLLLSAVSVLAILGGLILLRRRHVREQTPSLVQDLDRWTKAMPLAKPRVLYAGTQPVDRKALAKALKGKRPKAETPRRLRIVPDERRKERA
jgi:hypothetical protein